MSFKIDIYNNYTDLDGLVYTGDYIESHRRFQNITDNGVMYLSEFMLMLSLRNELEINDIVYYKSVISKCYAVPGCLQRSPVNNIMLEAPDDYYGYYAALAALKLKDLGNLSWDYGVKHYGSFNNVEPGKFTFKSMFWRQPQLLAMAKVAAGKSPGLLLSLYSAIIIGTGNMVTQIENTDSRRLAWLLIKTLAPVSTLCRLASKLWFKRLYKDYGPTGMQAVRKIYYGINHPFTFYSID